MLIFDSDTIRAINSLTVETFYLYEVHYDNSLEPLRLTNLSEDFVFEGQTYSKAAISQTEITQSADGKINDITISIGNVNRVMQSYVESYQMSGKRVRVMQLFKNCNSYMQLDYIIKTIKSNKSQVDFTCGLGFDALLLEVPKRTVLRDFCKWQFKDSNCLYAGADSTCSKQYNDCLRKGNISNFGGFPAVVTSRVFV